MNHKNIKLLALITTLLNSTFSSCHASDLQEDTIDKSTPAHLSSLVEHQIEELPYTTEQSTTKISGLKELKQWSASMDKLRELPTSNTISGLFMSNVSIKPSPAMTPSDLMEYFFRHLPHIASLEIDGDYKIVSSDNEYKDKNSRHQFMNPAQRESEFDIIENLIDILNVNNNLTRVHLNNISISDSNIFGLTSVLNTSETLIELSFKADKRKYSMPDLQIKTLLRNIKPQIPIKKLGLNFSQASEDSVAALIELLNGTENLKSLTVQDFKISFNNEEDSSEVINSFIKAIEDNRTLDNLDLTIAMHTNRAHFNKFEKALNFTIENKKAHNINFTGKLSKSKKSKK